MSVSPDLNFSTVAEQAAWVANGAISARNLVIHSLNRIASLDSVINAFAFVRASQALAEADELDAYQESHGVRGPLHGVPIAIKQENDVAGLPTQLGGAANITPATADSEVVRRLRSAGAIIIGTTRMPEFGIWPYTESKAHGWTRNPWNILRSTAGSSGGSAAAVAAGMVAAAIGGDGGGSIRLPSSWCGLFGLKPQRGRVSTSPNDSLWRALGAIGPLTRTVSDSALIYDIISGTTPVDRFSASPLPDTMSSAVDVDRIPNMRIMVSAANPMRGPKPDAETLRALTETAQLLRELGHDVIEDDPKYPSMTHLLRSQVAAGVADEAARVEHPEMLEALTRRMLTLTRPTRRRADSDERKSAHLSATFLAELFDGIDLLITPTTPTAAEPIGQLDGVSTLAAFRKASAASSFTAAWNLLGNPAAAVPAGFTADGLPLSVQIIGPTGGELPVLALSAQLEAARPWAQARPDIVGQS